MTRPAALVSRSHSVIVSPETVRRGPLKSTLPPLPAQTVQQMQPSRLLIGHIFPSVHCYSIMIFSIYDRKRTCDPLYFHHVFLVLVLMPCSPMVCSKIQLYSIHTVLSHWKITNIANILYCKCGDRCIWRLSAGEKPICAFVWRTCAIACEIASNSPVCTVAYDMQIYVFTQRVSTCRLRCAFNLSWQRLLFLSKRNTSSSSRAAL